MSPANSFQRLAGVNSPKATVSFLPRDSWYVPLIALSFGQAFFTEDPRIGIAGTGTAIGSSVATSHSYQMVASKTIHKTDVRLTLGHVTSSAELTKIDPIPAFSLTKDRAGFDSWSYPCVETLILAPSRRVFLKRMRETSTPATQLRKPRE